MFALFVFYGCTPIRSPTRTKLSTQAFEFLIISSSNMIFPFSIKVTIVDPPNAKYPRKVK